MTIFREEALASSRPKNFSDVVLVVPVSLAILAAIAAAAAACCIAFLLLGSYTRRSTVTGQLRPNTGWVTVTSQQSGVILERHVGENEPVAAGQLLFVIADERRSQTMGDTDASNREQILHRRAALQEETQATTVLQTGERRSIEKRLASLRIEAELLRTQIDDQQAHIKLKTQTVQAYEAVVSSGYVGKEQLRIQQEELLDQQSRMKSLKRELAGVDWEQSQQQGDLAALTTKYDIQRAQLARELSAVTQELNENETRRRLVITAPESGIATAVIAQTGQPVEAGRTLLNIVPEHYRLEAELLVPSRAVGFVKAGNRVILRYQAYPYQRFGHPGGVVSSVTHIPLPSSAFANRAGPAIPDEPLYKVEVTLDSQTIQAYGREEPLKPGMLLEADILLEKRRLYQWILEPLYSLSSRV